MNEGYAAVFREREILVKTVSETPRAAMVNWLVACKGIMLTNSTPDFLIRDAFDKWAPSAHVTIEPVSLHIVARARP